MFIHFTYLREISFGNANITIEKSPEKPCRNGPEKAETTNDRGVCSVLLSWFRKFVLTVKSMPRILARVKYLETSDSLAKVSEERGGGTEPLV